MVAHASNSFGGLFASLIPILLIICVYGLLLRSIAKRKGRREWLWFLAAFVPLWNFWGGLWLVSLPDKKIIEELKALRSEARKYNSILKGGQATSTFSDSNLEM